MCLSWVRSSIGKKILMALSGAMLAGFVVMHLLGNLLIFRGQDALNAYAKKLADLGPLLWAARIGLILAVIIHIITSIQLSRENRSARPQAYARQRSESTTLAARTMLISGIILLAYLLYHLAHFTFGWTHPELYHMKDPLDRYDVYGMVVGGFRNAWVVAGYIIGVGMVCLHLSHGLGSMVQTLGLNNEKTIPVFTWAGRIGSAVIFLGYVSIPLAVMLGYLK